MKNSKKTIATVSAICLSGAMIAVSGLAMSANMEGYNYFKESLIESVDAGPMSNEDNWGHDAYMTLSKDGEMIYEMASQNTFVRTNDLQYKDHTFTTATSSGVGASMESWSGVEKPEEDYFIQKMSNDDTYYRYITQYDGEMLQYRQETLKGMKDSDEDYTYEQSPAMKQFLGALIDLVVGDAKNYFSKDSNNRVSVKLEGAQIPEIAQLGLSAIMSDMSKNGLKGGYDSEMEKDQLGKSIFAQQEDMFMKEIMSLQDVKFEMVEVAADMNNGAQDMQNLSLAATVAGYDNNGKKHSYSVTADQKNGTANPSLVEIPDLSGAKVVDNTEKYAY